MSVTGGFKNHHPNSEIHWIVRKDLASLLKIDPRIDHIWEFDRKAGIRGLMKLAFHLKNEGYTHIYDAHSNIRSTILKFILCPFNLCNWNTRPKLVTRRKNRLKRLLLFKFRINLLPKPFRSFESFRKPLNKWNITNFYTPDSNWKFSKEVESKCADIMQYLPSKTITLVPSAAWELKKWPVHYWQKLITLLPDFHFVILAGPQDTFCEEIKRISPERVINLAGKTSLLESFCITDHSKYVVSGDTGFLHAADLFNKSGIALIGPTAFGYPSGKKMKVFERNLPCQPCSKDGSRKCKLKETKKCLTDIRPELLVKEINQFQGWST
jgi:heptosyltransferase-2